MAIPSRVEESPGAISPIGAAYGLRTIVDDELEAQQEVYFEAGDHENLVHMTAAQFMALLGPAQRAHFAQHERRTHPGSGRN